MIGELYRAESHGIAFRAQAGISAKRRLSAGVAGVVAGAFCLLAQSSPGAPKEQTRSFVPVDAIYESVLHGGVVGAGKAAGDTLYLLGGPNRPDGKFQDSSGQPDAQGWIGVDRSARTSHWHIDTFNAANLDATHTPNHAMWCGQYDNCTWPTSPGYGNDWNDWLDWYGTVSNNAAPTALTISAQLNYDAEPYMDFLYLEIERSTGMDGINNWTDTNADHGDFTAVAVAETLLVDPSDYVGSNHDQIHLRWRAHSDNAGSDQDGLWPTDGLCQVDNIEIRFSGERKTYDDFEPGSPVNWTSTVSTGVGNFAKVWPHLTDLDPCRYNNSPQFAFIDDGLVVPGTDGTMGITWTYGPGGFVHNMTGGLQAPDGYLHNEIWSPPIEWPAGYDGAVLTFDVYRHLPFVFSPPADGVFYEWHIRSSHDGGVCWTNWQDRGFVYYSSAADYLRHNNQVGDLLTESANLVQIALGVIEIGWIYGLEGIDGTPAPYFDNVQMIAYASGGPSIAMREIDGFNDAFPANGSLNLTNLGANSVRVDMAHSISPASNLRNDPGDSVVVDVVPRGGRQLHSRPSLHVRMKANPLFDSYRTLPAGFLRSGGLIEGTVLGDSTHMMPSYAIVPNRWNWDLPDTGFFFPGDAFHYYVEAEDEVGAEIGLSRLPADTTGFSLFPGAPGYQSLRFPSAFKVNALPTLRSSSAGDQPGILFWNDAGSGGGEDEWFGALDNLGYREGIDYDVYFTNGPSSGVGNGLGGRASSAQLDGYNTILYTSGDLDSYTLSNGDYNKDPGNDIELMNSWLFSGNRNWFCTGNRLVSNLKASGAAATTFMNTWLPVTCSSFELRGLIGDQVAPLVRPIAGNPILTHSYTAFGGCPYYSRFDAVTVTGTATRLAEFTSSAGDTGVYQYAATVLNYVSPYHANVVYMPYDFMRIYGGESGSGTVRPVRADVLKEVLDQFSGVPSEGGSWAWGEVGGGTSSGVNAIVRYGNSIVVGGAFTQVGGVAANRIAMWNGTTWSALGEGFAATVRALTVYQGELVAGGDFTTSGAVTVDHIARWNGSGWSALGSGLGGRVNALAANENVLYAAGPFTKSGNTDVHRMARWNGVAWEAVGGGLDNEAYALTMFDGELIAAGKFTKSDAGSPSMNHIGRWNGSVWQALGPGIGSASSDIPYALAVSGSDLVAGGSFYSAGSLSVANIALWDGSTWSVLGNGLNSTVRSLTAWGDRVIAGGDFTASGITAASRIAQWNGFTWLPIGQGLGSSGYALEGSTSDLLVGGSFATAGGVQARNLAQCYFTSTVVAVPGGSGRSPHRELAIRCSPNPFNPTTTIAYDLPADGLVQLDVYDLRGRRVRALVGGRQIAGRHEVKWDGRDEGGQATGSGVYLFRIVAGTQERIVKTVLIR